MARSNAGESVLTRAMRILRLFTSSSPTLTVSEIARRAGLPVATAHRLVNELVELGALDRVEGRQVRMGYQLWELASRSSRALDLREVAMPFMEDLQTVVRQHTQIGVLEGTDVLYLERLSARGAVQNITRIAGRLPIHATSAGLVLLAHSPLELQEEVLSQPLPRYTPRTVTDPAQLRSLLAQVRREGFVVATRMISQAGTGVAVPVRGEDGEVVAALSVVIPAADPHPRAPVPALQAAGRGISRAMGAPAVDEDVLRSHGPRLPGDGRQRFSH
ncbi:MULTISPECIES: IclR family transcriptional regulator [unclassified Streptomyces]|uniref:IclR family transcriptional regulator n=1 Tax=unclassified Streptomyces TaxID=2593676 RepID=UPI00093A5E42|nr:IclR family transcriptional regulator [Streptomyces sp. CB02058]OKI88849.1 IclR family transcriptional regulator [Streptomyces sp. CB02058]